MGRRGWGQKAWIMNYWLTRMDNPFEEPYSIRQVFYKELPQILELVPQYVRENTKDWAGQFYNKMIAYLSNLVLAQRVSYREINIFDDSGASAYVWQNFKYYSLPPREEAVVEFPVEVWVENNATYNSLIPLFRWNAAEGEPYRFQLNLISQRGVAKTQQIEAMLLGRSEDVKVILNLTDFDPTGYYMAEDLANRCALMGLNVAVVHIGIFPRQIPEERKAVSLVTYKRNDPRCERFREEFRDDPMVMDYRGYEIQAPSPPEIRALVEKSVEDIVDKFGFR